MLSIRGTRGDDLIDVNRNAAGDMIELAVNGAAAATFPLSGVDRIRILCGAGDDEVTVSEEMEISARIRGGRGNDSLTGGGGDDHIRGRRGDDEIDGGSGNDRLFGGRGDDAINGGDGDDHIYGRRGNDTIDGEEGNDRIRGGQHDDPDGGPGNDTAFGGPGRDSIENAERMHDHGARNEGVAAERRLRHFASERRDRSALAAIAAERSPTPNTQVAPARSVDLQANGHELLDELIDAEAVDAILAAM